MGAGADSVGWRAVGTWLLVFLVGRTGLQEGFYGLAAACSSHSLLATGLAWLASHRRAGYLRHRELLVTLASLHVLWVSHNLTLHGGTNLFALHRGSPLLLLFTTVVCNGGLWVALYQLFARLDVRWSRVALPLLSLAPLALTRRVCGRMLEGPGVEDPLLALHAALELAHSSTVFPMSLFPPGPPETSPDPLQQCAALSAWSLLLCALAVPLIVLQRLEQGQRNVFTARQAVEAAAAGGSRQARAVQAASQQVHEHAVQEMRSWLPVPWLVLELYFSSCTIWALVNLARPLLLKL